MSESTTHARLVRAILEFIDREFSSLSDIAVRDDASFSIRGENPPLIGGFVPDVYAATVPTTMTIIGEAKTRRDLETERSIEQISAFLNYLSATKGGVFILSVPLVAAATARRILELSGRSLASPSTRVIVLDGLT
jgi:hypothetical protein